MTHSDIFPISLAGTIVFWLASIIYALWFKNIERTRRTVVINKDKITFKYSRQIIIATAMGCAILGYMHVVQLIDQGFYLREMGVEIWWPRYVAYALSVGTLMYTFSVFLWLKTKDKAVNVLLGVAFWIVSGLIASFTLDTYQWVQFGIGFAPLIGAFYILWFRKTRSDNFAILMVIALAIIFLFYAANWVVSIPGLNILTRATSWWIYLGLDIVTYIIVPYNILRLYISKKDARTKKVNRPMKNPNNFQQQQQQHQTPLLYGNGTQQFDMEINLTH